MIVLKQLTHDLDTNTVEATWVDRIQLPDTKVPESFGPTTRNEDGDIVPGELIPAHTVKGGIQDTQIKCHSYADVQMQMFRDDAAQLGTPIEEYEGLIATVEAGIKPPTPISADIRKAELIAQIAALDLKRIRPMVEGDTIYLGRLTMQIKALRDELKGVN